MIKPKTTKVGILQISYENYQNKYLRDVIFSVITPINIEYSKTVLNILDITFESEFIPEMGFSSFFDTPKHYVAVVNGVGQDCKFVEFTELPEIE